MGRVLEALKTLETRRQLAPEPSELDVPRWPTPDPIEEPLVAEVVEVPLEAAPTAPTAVSLPNVPTVADHYLKLSERIADQLAGDCSVLMFASGDYRCGANFSLTQLAQAFSLQSRGNLLVVDGELRGGRLSQSAGVIAPGMIEVMLGTATWSEAIRPSTIAGIDFVPCGNSEVPTFERPGFGWSELREKYRVVLIGLNDVGDAETAWLASRCDATYFVISRPHTPRQAASEALDKLRAAGSNMLGCIVTGG